MQIRLLVLTLSARPSSLFAIHVRSLPPHLTASPNAPHPQHRPFALSLRSSLLTDLARILYVPPSALLSPPAGSGTDAQALLPASLGGISLPDLLLLAIPCYLASFADTLPLQLLDPLLAPHLSSPALWPSSP